MIEHTCDDCNRHRNEPEKCLCDPCLEDLKQESYDEGYKEGKQDGKKENE